MRGAASKTVPMGREVGSWMRDVWRDAREFRQCRRAKIGRDASWWDDHTCTMASGSSLRMERMMSALVTASREANNLFREVSYCSHNPRFDTERDIPDVETSNWRAVCGKTASTVRREGRREPSLPLSCEPVQLASLMPSSAAFRGLIRAANSFAAWVGSGGLKR